MKKIAIAVAAAMVGSAAAAANVEIYGVVDLGLGYTNLDDRTGTTETFEMINGYNSGSRFGLKGTEDLGNGYAVSFVLENGFASDSGELGQDGRMFGREALLKLHSPYGTLSFGRAGTIMSGAGSLDVFGGIADTLPGGWDGQFNVLNYQGNARRYDNMVTYQTPTAAGFTGYAQYSFANDTVKGGDNDAVDNMRDTNRYVALALTYVNGPVKAIVAYDTVMFKHYGPTVTKPAGDSLNVGDNRNITVGGSYDFGFMKVSGYVQKTEGVRSAYGFGMWNYDPSGATVNKNNDADGYNYHLGAQFPFGNNRVYVAGYYGKLDGNVPSVNGEIENMNFLLAHEYDLSKRTMLYSGLAYHQVKAYTTSGTMDDKKATQFVAGMRHIF